MKDLPSTRPYLIRAMHQWCEDNGFTAYLAVSVDASVRVPRQHVVDGEIVLNVSTDATGGLNLGNDVVEFKARFGGIPQSISIPVGRVHAIYARENGQGMAFPIEDVATGEAVPEAELTAVSHAESGRLSLVGSDDMGSGETPVNNEVELGKDEASSNTDKPTRPTLTRIK